MPIRPHRTLNSRQSARSTLSRAEVSAALAASRKELSDLKVEYPNLFKEWGGPEYRTRSIHETNNSIIVRLECPPVGEVVVFEVSKNESGTLAPLAKHTGPSQTQLPELGLYRARQGNSAAHAARFRALVWWCEQLEERLQPPSTSALLRPVVRQEPREQSASSLHPEPRSPAQAPDEAPRESKSEVRPSILPQQAKVEEDDTGTGKPTSARIQAIGHAVAEMILRFENGGKVLEKAKRDYPAIEGAWKEAIKKVGLTGDRDLEFLVGSRTAKAAACKKVAHLSCQSRRPIKPDHAANYHKKYLDYLKQLKP